MKVLRQICELASLEGGAHLAIGVFDGLHRGHQAVIAAAIESARAGGGVPVVVTFDPHPVALLRPEAAPLLLTSAPHQEKILAELGVEHLLVIEFDKEFAARTAEDFIRQLAEVCRPLRQICVGAEWKFGRGRSGDVALLERLGAELGFAVTGVAPVLSDDGETISSTLVRQAVGDGDLLRARELLGRGYTVLGDVIAGRKLGRTIGFPTANLAVHSEQLPPNGVYAVSVDLDGRRLDGVANLGTRPTVEAEIGVSLLEVHLLSFDEEIYGRCLEVSFNARLREERKFSNLDELKSQIARDVAAVRVRRDE